MPNPQSKTELENIKDRSLKDMIERIQKKYCDHEDIGKQAQDTAIKIKNAIAPGGHFPPIQETFSFSPLPTDLCRVSPFFPMAKKDLKTREMIVNMIITSSSWGEIKYTGAKLSTYDEDCLLAILALINKSRKIDHVEGKKTYTYKGPILPVLKLMGLTGGKENYKRIIMSTEFLHCSSVRLTIYKRNTRGKRKIVSTEESMNMLSYSHWDTNTKELTVTVNPFFYETFFNGQVTLLDVVRRSKIKLNVAKCLYRFIQSHDSHKWEGRYTILAETLNLDKNQPEKQIKRQIKNSISELKSKNILMEESGFIGTETVRLLRAYIPTKKTLQN